MTGRLGEDGKPKTGEFSVLDVSIELIFEVMR